MLGYTTVSKSTCVRHTHSSAEAAEMTTLQEISYFYLKDTVQLGQSQLSSTPVTNKMMTVSRGLLRPRNESLLFCFQPKFVFLAVITTPNYMCHELFKLYGQVASLNILWERICQDICSTIAAQKPQS